MVCGATVLVVILKADSVEWDLLMNAVRQKDAVRTILAMSRRGNQYMQSQQPWVLMKGSEDEKYGFSFHFTSYLVL